MSSSHSLVGKFFTNSTPPSFEETEQSLRKQWNLYSDMTVRKLDDIDLFFFELSQENDKDKILRCGPYNVNGVIIVIKDLFSPNVNDFTVASFDVAVLGIPSYLRIKEFVPQLKSLIGGSNPELWRMPDQINTNFYFRVDIDLKKPLKSGFYLQQNLHEHLFVQFKYRNLGDFCYKCGMIGHLDRSCDQVRFPKERALNGTSTTHVYGPWIRSIPTEPCYQTVLKISPEKQIGVRECEKTLSYAQFFIEIVFNKVTGCNPYSTTRTMSTHRFRFPCSYLDTETESTDSCPTTSKAYEVIRREICENAPSSFRGFEQKSLNKPDVIRNLVEQLKLMKKVEFCSDDKWLTLKLQINQNYMLTPVDYETFLTNSRDTFCEWLTECRISDLIKKRVENNENLLSLSSWESQIREAISEMGLTQYVHPFVLSRIANEAMRKAIEMEISLSSCTVPADRSTIFGLERFKVVGSDMDRLDPCMICAEEMFLGEEATIMPCSHVFHSSCIEKWLGVGHKCPLCGFKLPSQK